MAIPEFVLRKLVVPGSLKKSGNGFSFIILNTFAPATITKFELINKVNPIPAQSITFSSSVSPAQKADKITAENPVLTPVGVEILVSVEDQPLTDAIIVKAMTKEVGEILFSLAEKKEKKKQKKIKPYLISRFAPAQKARLHINPGEVAKIPASPFILGQFVEHLERCVYDGVWKADGSELRQDTLDLIQQLNPPIIRYPGGNFASGYHWEDGIGPKEKRPARHDAAWQAEESNLVGTDEFLAFCELIGTEPLLVVNDGSGTAEEAARWVEYCNGATTSEGGRRRAANGHVEPYGVKYWGIGNEVWGAWQIGTTSAKEYVKRLKRFIKAMKSVDQTIVLVAVGDLPLTADENDPAALWNQEVLSSAGDLFDYLSWHIYQPDTEGWKEMPDALEVFKSICAASMDIETYIQRIEKEIADFSPNKKVLQALDEWNVWLPPLPGAKSMHQVTYTMRDALYTACVLAACYRNAHTLGMANLAQLVNVLPLIMTNEQTAIGSALLPPFILFNQMERNVVASSCEGPTYESQAMGPNIHAHKNVPALDHLLTVSEDGKRYTLLLINRLAENRLEVHFVFDAKPGESAEISATHPLAANIFEHPDRVQLQDGLTPKMDGDEWKITLKPASIVMLEFKKG